MPIEVRPLSYALGAEIRGVDIASSCSTQDRQEIHKAFLQYGILLFRGQRITREQHIAFSRNFGELDRHESLPMDRDPKYNELLMVTNDSKADGSPSNSRYTGQMWHSDMSFTLAPAMGSLLRAVEVPQVGGDTLFANMYLAYETLSSRLKAMISDLHGIHHSERKNSGLSAQWEAENRTQTPGGAAAGSGSSRDRGARRST